MWPNHFVIASNGEKGEGVRYSNVTSKGSVGNFPKAFSTRVSNLGVIPVSDRTWEYFLLMFPFYANGVPTTQCDRVAK